MSAVMRDGNTAALNRKMADDDRDDDLMRMAEADRKRLVQEYIADYQSTNERALCDLLSEAAGEPEFLHDMQRLCRFVEPRIRPNDLQDIAITAMRLAVRFSHFVDTREGDELVQDAANRLARGNA